MKAFRIGWYRGQGVLSGFDVRSEAIENKLYLRHKTVTYRLNSRSKAPIYRFSLTRGGAAR